MTAEIAIMNRNAVVLAADSATTVTSWNNGESEKRYFKGANKLFELSRVSPVGLMIYGSASLHGVPWELVIKAFRQSFGPEQCDSLHDYADHFFDFVQGSDRLFPSETKSAALIELIGGAGFRFQKIVAKQLGLGPDDGFEGIDAARVEVALNEVEAQIDERPIESPLTQEDISHTITSMKDAFADAVSKRLEIFTVGGAEVLALADRFAELLIKQALKDFRRFTQITGIVIAGYGKDDFYPAMEVFQCFGFVGERLLYERLESDSKIMSPTAEAVIQPFATTSMIDTFRFGVAPDIFEGAFDSTQQTLMSFAQTIAQECSAGDEIPGARLGELVTAALDGHSVKWADQMRERHFEPLSKVIHSLPILDMAALAKSLIELESLKERVTKPSESVSGPIDVAVISKHDGFIWLDRKHYFRPELNPRFFKRGDYL